MIRDFEQTDLGSFEPNFCSRPSEVAFVFDTSFYEKYSLIRDGIVRAILCLISTDKDEWAGFFLVSKRFNVVDAKELRRFVANKVTEYGAKRIWTLSIDHPVIERWHKFLGMEKERPVFFSGKSCFIWSREWASKLRF